jgi:hypothetical protein
MTGRKDTCTEAAFAENAKRRFDESVAGLDGETRSRLNRSRHAALAELDSGRPAWARWLPAAGVAAGAAVALLLWTGDPPVEDLASPAIASDIEILLTEDSLEMLEDLEFYSWIDLDEESDEASAPQNHVG